MNQQQEIEKRVRALCRVHNADRLFVLTDSNVHPLTAGMFADAPRLVVEAGEESKSLKGVEQVWYFLEDSGAIRRSVLVNIGGGMISDLGGFAAATFKRGMGCVNLPTTLLAAVDAAIGGKTGINFAGLKNEIGAFSLPWGVFPLLSLFTSLPEKEWLSGAGEAIKTGLLDSEELFDMATSEKFLVKREPEIVDEVVRRCAEFKNKIVAEDFKEGGRRKILNLGHTAGHAIESWKMAHGEYMPHGIAIAHGLKVALEKSVREAGMDENVLNRFTHILNKFFPPLEMNENQWKEVSAFMAHDKKNKEKGSPSWVLLKAIGHPVI